MEIIGAIGLLIGVVVFFGLLFSWPVMMLWNSCLVDAVNGVNEITWLQAWGIMVLCGLLFKSSLSKKD
jgi:hypothetical protein